MIQPPRIAVPAIMIASHQNLPARELRAQDFPAFLWAYEYVPEVNYYIFGSDGFTPTFRNHVSEIFWTITISLNLIMIKNACQK